MSRQDVCKLSLWACILEPFRAFLSLRRVARLDGPANRWLYRVAGATAGAKKERREHLGGGGEELRHLVWVKGVSHVDSIPF